MFSSYSSAELIEKMDKGIKMYCQDCGKHTKHIIEGRNILYTACNKCGKSFMDAPTGIKPFLEPNSNALTILLAIGIMIGVVVGAFEVTHYIKNVEILRLIWAT